MASRSAALGFSATTTATGGRRRSRLLVVCCDSSRRSDLLSSSLAAKVLGAPTTFDVAKLTVHFAGETEEPDHRRRRPAFPRAYTLSHCDFTANLTLAVSETITSDQLRQWRRGDVFAEWKASSSTSNGGSRVGGEMMLHLHCHVSGPNPLQELAARFRYYVFSKELPLVLKAVVHADGALFAAGQTSWRPRCGCTSTPPPGSTTGSSAGDHSGRPPRGICWTGSSASCGARSPRDEGHGTSSTPSSRFPYD